MRGEIGSFSIKLELSYIHTIFVDNNGSFIHKIIGYRNPKKFLTILNYISSRAYKRVTFEEFEDESVTDR